MRFPVDSGDFFDIINGLKKISGLPYCLVAVDGTHIKWPACPLQQLYEYRGYKGYPIIVLFAIVSADRLFLFVDILNPGVLGDCTLLERSKLKNNTDDGVLLGELVPDLVIAEVPVLPYLIVDCAFCLDVHMMKATSEQEKRMNMVLREWDTLASQTMKPVDCASGILKGKFGALNEGVRVTNEDAIVSFTFACLILQKPRPRRGGE